MKTSQMINVLLKYEKKLHIKLIKLLFQESLYVVAKIVVCIDS